MSGAAVAGAAKPIVVRTAAATASRKCLMTSAFRPVVGRITCGGVPTIGRQTSDVKNGYRALQWRFCRFLAVSHLMTGLRLDGVQDQAEAVGEVVELERRGGERARLDDRR